MASESESPADKAESIPYIFRIFSTTYVEVLRELKKESTDKQFEEKKEIPPFAQYSCIISDEDFEPITQDLMFKKLLANKYFRYTFDIPKVKLTKPIPSPSSEIFLRTQLEDDISPDILTGYLIGRYYLSINIIQNFISFHTGISSDGFIRGLYLAFKNKLLSHFKGEQIINQPKLKWHMFGCDRKFSDKYADKFINGIKKPCDVFDMNSIRSIRLQSSEKLANIQLFIADIFPKTHIEVLKQWILLADSFNEKTEIVLRLPYNWLNIYTQMCSVILFFISYYKYVAITKMPWNGHIYLIIKHPKIKISRKIISTIESYVVDGAEYPLFHSSAFYDDKEMLDHMSTYISNMALIYKKLSLPSISDEEQLTEWSNVFKS